MVFPSRSCLEILYLLLNFKHLIVRASNDSNFQLHANFFQPYQTKEKIFLGENNKLYKSNFIKFKKKS